METPLKIDLTYQVHDVSTQLSSLHKFSGLPFRNDNEASQYASLLFEFAVISPGWAYTGAVTRYEHLNRKHKNLLIVKFIEKCKEIDLNSKQEEIWQNVRNLGTFISLLYQGKQIDILKLSQWHDILFSAALNGNSLASEELLISYKFIFGEIKTRDRKYFNLCMDRTIVMKGMGNVSVNLIRDVLQCDDSSKSPKQTQAQKKTQKKPGNVIEEFQKIVNRMNFGNHVAIIAEIVALKIPSNEKNLKKIANTLMSTVLQKPDLNPCACEILAKLPESLIPKIDKTQLKEQIKTSLMKQFENIKSGAVDQKTKQFVEFTKELHLRTLIGDEEIKEIIERLALSSRDNAKDGLELLINIIMTFDDNIVKRLNLSEAEITLNQQLEVAASVNEDNLNALRVIENLVESSDENSTISIVSSSNIPKRKRIRRKKPKKSADKKVKSLTAETVHNEIKETSTQSEFNFEASTSKSTVKESKPIASFFENLKVKTFDEIRKFVQTLNVASQSEMTEFAECFVESAVESEEILFYVKLAEWLNVEIDHGIKNSFQCTLCDVVKDLLESTSTRPNNTKKRSILLVEFFGELCKIKWIEFKKVQPEDFDLEITHKLLKTVSLSIVKEGNDEIFVKYREIIIERRSTAKNARSFFMCSEILSILENIMNLCENSKPKFDASKVKKILNELSLEFQ